VKHALERLRIGGPLLAVGLLATGLLTTLLTDAVAPLVGAVVVIAVAGHAPRVGWRQSLALVLLTALVLQVCFAWLTPHVGWSLATDNTAAWTLFGLVHAPLVGLGDRSLLGRRRLYDAAAVLAVPALLAVYFAWTAATSGAPWLGWAMAGDAANNMLLNRELTADGGLISAHLNPVPLTTVIHAAWGAPTAAGMDRNAAVQAYVETAGHLQIVLIMLVSVLASALALREGPTAPAQRASVGSAAGLVPWLWCVAGQSFIFGFQNAVPTMLILLLTWLCWVTQRQHPVGAVTGLVLGTWAAAMVWGPLVPVPAALLLTACLRQHRALMAAGRALLLPGAVLAAAAAYGLLVTVPDLRSTGGVPGVEGSHPYIDATWGLVASTGLAGVVLVCGRRLRSDVRWGFWATMPAVALGIWLLARPRQAAGLPAWGYYPVKFTWIVASVTLVVLASELMGPLGRAASRAWRGNGVLATLALCSLVMIQVNPPMRPLTPYALLTPVWLRETTFNDPVYARMFALMEEEPSTLVARYWPGPDQLERDNLINFWMLQSAARDLSDPLRVPAYATNSSDAASVCTAISAWGGAVRVLTRDAGLERDLDRACGPDATYVVRVVGRAAPA
jgi:hypothetical protein